MNPNLAARRNLVPKIGIAFSVMSLFLQEYTSVRAVPLRLSQERKLPFALKETWEDCGVY